MNSAIIVLKNTIEKSVAEAKYLDTNLLSSTISKLKGVEVDKLYLVGSNKEFEDVLNRNSIEEAFEDIKGHDGKTLLVSPFYPKLKKYHYEALYMQDDDGCTLKSKDTNINIYMLNNNRLKDYKSVNFNAIEIEQNACEKVNSLEELQVYSKNKQNEINKKLTENNVVIIDPNNTYIGEDVRVEKGTIIYPNVYLEGKTKIGENSEITSGSHLLNAIVGNNTKVISSRIDSSTVGNNVTLGPNSHLRMQSFVKDECRIGNFVEFKNTIFGKGSKCAHLTYLGDCEVGENVNIGCGVVTVNYDGKNKYHTIIKDNSFIGSNANIIAPVTIGAYAVIAAGSTVTENVPDKDMAIARCRQINKEGYGYKYIKKEN